MSSKPIGTMTGVSSTQLDEFLRFIRFFLLQISSQGNLLSIRPAGRTFLGWDAQNIAAFDFRHHFLDPNQLTFDLFATFFEEKDFHENQFLWKSPEGKTSLPLPTFIRYVHHKTGQKSYLIFVKDPEDYAQFSMPVGNKKFIFQAWALPGFIHNINGPLGTITGRIELLQYQHPQISEFDEIIRVGYRLQGLLENVSYKVINEKRQQKTKINLNRFLREEIAFLNCDLFFKHQVEKVNEFSSAIPEFDSYYDRLSGIFSETYYFFRRYTSEQDEYVFLVKSFLAGSQIGFSIEFTGPFVTEVSGLQPLPLQLEGDHLEVARSQIPGLDTRYLSYCMEATQGIIHISAQPQSMKMRYEFPIPLT